MFIWPSLFLLVILLELVGIPFAGRSALSERPTVKNIPPSADFSFTFTPSLVTLFRFSALMFNAHLIHLDKDWAQSSRGYPGQSS
jgi:hydroxyacyl-ACP dehydratase HTD2-like protein with hotdog domain